MTTTLADAVELLDALGRIDSVTPWLIPGGAGEGEISRELGDRMRALGLEVTREEIQPGRFNVLGRLRGATPGPTICLNAHSDTVGYASWLDRALVPSLDGDLLTGLGVADDKGGCAVALLAVRELIELQTPLAGDVLIAFVADEEGISIGTEHLVAHHATEIDLAIVLEPEGSDLIVAEHQGFGWIDVIVHGTAAHGSAAEVGVDAIVNLAHVITRLNALDTQVWKAKPNVMNGRTVFHTGVIAGGTDYATYPDRVVLGIEIGTQPGETLADRVADIEGIFDQVRREVDPRFVGEVQVRLDRDPFTGRGNEGIIAALIDATTAVLGTPATVTGMNAWTDAALMQSAGVPTVMYGPSGGNFHAAEEWVSISDVVRTTEIVRRAISSLLAPATEKSSG
jgi:acetylornithine deacetylase/succinyl-diaminopimelate desuccinylase-like protein